MGGLSAPLNGLVAQQVRDSAGIRIVTYERNAAPKQQWRLESKPILQIGGTADEGPTAFAGIAGVVRLSDGRIAVGNASPSEIRLFSNSGAFQRALGRNGQGPGEFNQRLFRLLRSGDSLIGIDNTTRAQVFGPGGDLHRSLQRPHLPTSGGAPMRVVFGVDGSAIVYQAETATPQSRAGETLYVQLYREKSEDQYLPVLRVPAYQSTGAPVPLNSIVYGPAGRVAADAARICIGFSSAFAVTCHDHMGRPLMSIRRAFSPRAITEDDRRFYRDMLLAGAKGAPPNVTAMVEDVVRRTEFASRAPAFGRWMLAQSGDIWVSEFDRSELAVGSPTFRTTKIPLRWSVFSPDGTWLSDIRLPAHFRPFEMGPDYVIGVSLDEDDLERVTLYRIRR